MRGSHIEALPSTGQGASPGVTPVVGPVGVVVAGELRQVAAKAGELASAREEVARLERLADDLLVLARLDENRLPLHRERPRPRRPSAVVPEVLRQRDFRDVWLGSLASNAGSWLQIVASGWLILQATDSPAAVGALALVTRAPAIALSAYAGGLADRFDRRSSASGRSCCRPRPRPPWRSSPGWTGPTSGPSTC